MAVVKTARLFPQFLSEAEAIERLETLTPREWEVLDLMMNGKKNREIAEKLQISPKTLDIHRANTTRKLRVSPFRYWQIWCPGVLAERQGRAKFNREG